MQRPEDLPKIWEAPEALWAGLARILGNKPRSDGPFAHGRTCAGSATARLSVFAPAARGAAFLGRTGADCTVHPHVPAEDRLGALHAAVGASREAGDTAG